MKGYFVTGIGTNVGKTICSAILCRRLQGDYWKPIQTGSDSDAERVRQLAPGVSIHNSLYRFREPVSPHTAAKIEGIAIDFGLISLPLTSRPIIVEGAGGVWTPITSTKFMIDLMKVLALPVVVVSRFYIGAINHTLMTLHCLHLSGVKVQGLIANGDWQSDDLAMIVNMTGVSILGTLPWLGTLASSIGSENLEAGNDFLV